MFSGLTMLLFNTYLTTESLILDVDAGRVDEEGQEEEEGWSLDAPEIENGSESLLLRHILLIFLVLLCAFLYPPPSPFSGPNCRVPVKHCMAVPDSVPRPLVEIQPVPSAKSLHQSAALPVDQQGANRRKPSRWPNYRKSNQNHKKRGK